MIDKEHMLDHIEAFPRWILQAYDLASAKIVEKPVSNVLSMGMGGSGISGLLVKSLLADTQVPMDAVLSPTLPKDIGKETLAFIVSYSGNTLEALDAYREAQRKGCKIVAIPSGGNLAKRAISDEKMLIQVPTGIPPRASLPYLLFPMVRVLQNADLIPDQRDAVLNASKVLMKPEYRERGEDLAGDLSDRIPLIYSTPFMAPAAYRWKCQINENAKASAFTNVFPELMHNEVEGFTNLKMEPHVLMLREENVTGLVEKGFKVVKRELKQRCHVTELVFKERDPMSRLLSAVYIGDWVSYFLAIKYNTDPSPNPVISEVKRHIS